MKPLYQFSLILLFVIATALRLLTDISRPATRWDEQTNIDVVRETRETSSFPVLFYRDKPFFEKPPLWYYLNAGIIGITGTSPVDLRMVSLISGMVVILLPVWGTWHRYGRVAGLITWVILLFSHQLFIKDAGGIFSSHTLNSADPDSLQVAFMLITYYFLTRQYTRFSWIAAGLATGCAVLTKGPMGYLPLAVTSVIPYAGIRSHIVRTWALAVVIILPWYLAMAFTYGMPFLHEHVGYHLFTRAVLPIEGNGKPPWFFLGIIADPQINPLFPIAVLSGIVWFRNFKTLTIIEKQTGIITLMVLAIPSFLRTKLSWYILHYYPFMAIMAGMMISKYWKRITSPK